MNTIEDIKAPWTIEHTDLLMQLQSDALKGLSSPEASRRLIINGYNKIESGKKINPAEIALNQFISPFVLLLVLAAGLSFFFQEWLDGIAILMVILLNAAIGFYMELQAARSMDILNKMATVPARVLRDGKLIEVSSEEVVPGDVLFIEGGDVITADLRLMQAAQLQTNESTLTGESLPVEKKEGSLHGAVPLAERSNMLYKGTFVTRGNGYGLVVHTGMSTELGNIATMVRRAEHAATPLEKKIQVFSKKLIWITVVLVIMIFVAGLLDDQPVGKMLSTSIVLAVAAIPEGLPIVATLALAFGMLRMARHNVLVKKLSSVETLGGTNVICTDKTGTLTQNKIKAVFVQLPGMSSTPRKTTEEIDQPYWAQAAIADPPAYGHLQRIAAICNTASWYDDGGKEKESGDPLEVGLLKMVYDTGANAETIRSLYPKIAEVPFSSNTKIMATLHQQGEEFYVAAKGAAEALIDRCSFVLEENRQQKLTGTKKDEWLKAADNLATSGLRILAFAFKEESKQEPDFFHDLTLTGLIGFIDPARPEVPASIKECKSAGIKVVMVTGDHPATAMNIAEQLGLTDDRHEVIHGGSMKPYAELTTADKEKWLSATVFARVTPEQKLDLVTLYQEKKMIVGMTGDGVNDAPALKKADIGIAMGERGTQVAQEVADMILKDDAFSSIVLAIRQGRAIFDNIRTFVIFLLSCNLSELLIIAVAAVLNLHFQLYPLQILYINLVTDVLPALALGVTEAAPHVMLRKPYPSQVAIIDRKRWAAIFVYSAIILGTSISAVFVSHELLHQQESWNGELCNNILFYSLICSQILHVFNMSFEKPAKFFKSEVFRNKYVWYAVIACTGLTSATYLVPVLRKVLDISMHGWQDWCIVALAAFTSLFLIQLAKRIRLVI